MIIKATPISQKSFAPFGGLVSHTVNEPLAIVTAAFEHHSDATIPALEWVRPETHIALPTEVTRIERHPFSAQTFLPHKNSSFLVVVYQSEADGMPKLESAKAFLVSSDVGVTFARGVWHRSLAPMEADSGYSMAMMRTGRDDDTEFYELKQPVRVLLK